MTGERVQEDRDHPSFLLPLVSLGIKGEREREREGEIETRAKGYDSIGRLNVSFF